MHRAFEVTGISDLIEIFSWKILLEAAGIDPEGFGALMGRYADWMGQYFDALARCKAPVVMVHDDIVWTSGAFLAPAWYRRFLFPAYRRYFEPLLVVGNHIPSNTPVDHCLWYNEAYEKMARR
jgi:hypothetical protein